jgi:hypothetical protein
MLDQIRLLRGNVFQDFCGVLLSSEDPAFLAVNGRGGDGGNDGFTVAGDTVYQMYAPEQPILARVRNKIGESFKKAVTLRLGPLPHLRRLVFVTPFDLTPDMHAHLRDTAAATSLETEPWGATRIAALVLKHPQVRTAFSHLLIPDLVAEMRKMRKSIEEPRTVAGNDDIFGPYYEPHFYVAKSNPSPGNVELQADEWFRVRVYSETLEHLSFEPEEEASFLKNVRDAFWEERAISLEKAAHDRVLVENRPDDLRFHRRWGWWTAGVLGMAATLRSLTRDGAFSYADMALDLSSYFGLLAQLAGAGDAVVVVDVEPHRLSPVWEVSDLRLQGRVAGKLGGILEPGEACAAHRTSTQLVYESTIESLTAFRDAIVAEIVVQAARELHHARVSSREMLASLPRLREEYWQAQSR